MPCPGRIRAVTPLDGFKAHLEYTDNTTKLVRERLYDASCLIFVDRAEVLQDVSALFSYVRGNAPDKARHIAPTWLQQAQQMLQGNLDDPIAATLVAYTLLRVGDDQRQIWMEHLADWFHFLPDGAVLYGWSRIRAGQADAVWRWFHTALQRGIPMYYEGIRLLYEGLNCLQSLYPDDEEIARDASLAYRLASLANPASELTCLRLDGNTLSVRFVRPAPPARTPTWRTAGIRGNPPPPCKRQASSRKVFGAGRALRRSRRGPTA